MSLFNTPEYIADKKFGGPKYAGLRLLERVREELGVRTIPDYYSPGFRVFTYMNEGAAGQWIEDAKRLATVINDAYKVVLRGRRLEQFMADRVHSAFHFFDTKTFSDRHIKSTDHIESYLAKRKETVDAVEQFMRRHQSTLDDLFIFRSSAGIEDVRPRTFGLFDSRGHLGEAALDYPLACTADFYEINAIRMVMHNLRTRLNFVLCKFIYAGATGTVLSSFFGKGNHYVEIGSQNFTPGSNMGKRPGDMQDVNLITGNAEGFSIDMLVEAEEANKYRVKNVPSHASEEQIKATLNATTLLEKMCGFPVCVEFLYEDDSPMPTFLQVRIYAPNFRNKALADKDVNGADYFAPAAINPGEFRGPCYNLELPAFGLDDIEHAHVIDYLKAINKQSANSYALAVPSTLKIMPFIVHVCGYEVKVSAFDVVKDLCTHAKVFINHDERHLRTQHEYMNLIQPATKQMFLSVPGFKVENGTLIHAKSDGYRGIVNICR